MSILDRNALAASPLADLHALASELSIDGYRRLRKAELIDAILARQGGEPSPEEQPAEHAPRPRPTRVAPARSDRRRPGPPGGRGRANVATKTEEEGSARPLRCRCP